MQSRTSVCSNADNNSGDPKSGQASPAAELRAIARQVRQIGIGWSESPESIALNKELLAERIAGIARRLEGAP